MKGKIKFPILATILLIFAVFWLLNELEVLILNIPWIPIVLIIISIGLIFNRFSKNY
ncbi:MAG: hypothetical protein NUV46_00905 [Nanoarchaeota archaeon]|nr:hypothetical protein [Nanoarchaeota archaeon]